MFKLLSILEIGPFYRNVFGYDAIIYEDCIQFAM